MNQGSNTCQTRILSLFYPRFIRSSFDACLSAFVQQNFCFFRKSEGRVLRFNLWLSFLAGLAGASIVLSV